MNSVIDTDLFGSVVLWLDNLFVGQGSGYYSYSGTFNPSSGNINGYQVRAAPHRQFVYSSDYSLSPLTGFYEGDTRKTGIIDYNKGAILFTGTPTGSVSAQYLYKEVNIYPLTKPTESLLFDSQFQVNPKYPPAYTGFQALDQTYPAIFVDLEPLGNRTLCFGGLTSTIIGCRLTFLSDTQYLTSTVNRMLEDCKERNIPIFAPNQMPFNYLGGLKTGTFSYTGWRSVIQNDPDRVAFIKDVQVREFKPRVNDLIGSDIFGSFIDIDFELMRHRSPAV